KGRPTRSGGPSACPATSAPRGRGPAPLRHYAVPMRELTTDRLPLRPWTEDDVHFALDLYSRWEVQQYLGTAPQVLTNRAEAVARVERFAALDHPVHGIWLVADRTSGQPHGTLLLKDIPASGPELRPSGDTEIGWHLHPDSWGHGYATEAAR